MNLLEPYRQTYRYDAGNNLVQLLHQANSNTWQQTISLHPDNNRGTETQQSATDFDVNGNLLALNNIGTLDWHYNNSLNKLTRDNKTTTEYYIYDYQGNRVRTVLEFNQKIQRQRGYLPSLDISTHQNTLHIGTHILAEISKDTIESRYQLSSHLQSNTLELNDKAQTISYEYYYPYGGTALIAGKDKTQVRQKRYRYTSKEKDDSSGLSYYSARYLAPWLARWISPDSAGAIDGLNLYVYVSNNPLKYLDPTGHISTISWEHFVDIVNKHMDGKPILNFWVGEKHTEEYGLNLLTNLGVSINPVENFVMESTDAGRHEAPADGFHVRRNFYIQTRINKNASPYIMKDLMTLSQKHNYYIGRGYWNDIEDEYRNNLQKEQHLQGNSLFLIGSGHLLVHNNTPFPRANKNAFPAYKYVEPKTSIALVPIQEVDYKYFDPRRSGTKTQEFGFWVRGKDGSTENASLVFGQKKVMKKIFGNLAKPIPVLLKNLPLPVGEKPLINKTTEMTKL